MARRKSDGGAYVFQLNARINHRPQTPQAHAAEQARSTSATDALPSLSSLHSTQLHCLTWQNRHACLLLRTLLRSHALGVDSSGRNRLRVTRQTSLSLSHTHACAHLRPKRRVVASKAKNGARGLAAIGCRHVGSDAAAASLDGDRTVYTRAAAGAAGGARRRRERAELAFGQMWRSNAVRPKAGGPAGRCSRGSDQRRARCTAAKPGNGCRRSTTGTALLSQPSPPPPAIAYRGTQSRSVWGGGG
eukprot:354726-Chlamydomonas_euryale.AAC.5